MLPELLLQIRACTQTNAWAGPKRAVPSPFPNSRLYILALNASFNIQGGCMCSVFAHYLSQFMQLMFFHFLFSPSHLHLHSLSLSPLLVLPDLVCSSSQPALVDIGLFPSAAACDSCPRTSLEGRGACCSGAFVVVLRRHDTRVKRGAQS